MSSLIAFSVENYIKKAYKHLKNKTDLKNKALLRSTIIYTEDLVDECLKSSHNTKRDIKIAIELKEGLNRLIKAIDKKEEERKNLEV